jgi:hypothetical protein
MEEEQDFEIEDSQNYCGEDFEIILLEPYGGKNIGDIVTVNRGIYNTLLNLKKGLCLDCYEDDLDDRQRLVISIKHLNEEVDEYRTEIAKLYDENVRLKKQLGEDRPNKMIDLYEKK